MDRLKSALQQAITSTSSIIDSVAHVQPHAEQQAAGRPPLPKRRFASLAVENVIDHARMVLEPELAELFECCYPNTLDTTVEFHTPSTPTSPPDTFIITGDIPALWLRDATNQIQPYLPLLKSTSALRDLVLGLIHRQTRCVLASPYSNAFKKSPHQWGENEKDYVKPRVDPLVWEGKWEVDSLAAFLKLANDYYEATDGDDSSFMTDDWVKAIQLVLKTLRDQQKGTDEELESPSYVFRRITAVQTDTLMLSGRGPPAKRCGLIKSAFRPSDDACVYPFLIPSNAMLSVQLRRLSIMLTKHPDHSTIATELSSLSTEITTAIYQHGVIDHPTHGRIFAYEIDGYGNYLLIDDANVPSLLGLPYLEFCKVDDAVYQRTRKFVLSGNNMFHWEGKAGKGVGGVHVGLGWIWPMSIIMQALTTIDEDEKTACIQTLITSTAGTKFMHESFWKDDAAKYTRPWFAWANSLFGELCLRLIYERTGREPGNTSKAAVAEPQSPDTMVVTMEAVGNVKGDKAEQEQLQIKEEEKGVWVVGEDGHDGQAARVEE